MKKSIKKYQSGDLIKGTPDVYNFLVRYGVLDPNTTTPEQVMSMSPEKIKELVKMTGLPDTKDVKGEVIAQRPLEVTQKFQEGKNSFEDAFAAAPDGSIFVWNGKAYKKEYGKNGSPKKQQATEEEVKVSYVTNQLNNLQYGGLVNTSGYTPGTSTFSNPLNIIPSNVITMKNTPFDVIGISDNGQIKKMKAGSDTHEFHGAKYVVEIPDMQQGGYTDSSLKSIYDLLQNTQGLEGVMVDPSLSAGSKIPDNYKNTLLALTGLMNLQTNQGNTSNNVDLSSRMINAYQMGGAPSMQAIQAEVSEGQDEYIRLADGRLSPVKADKAHKDMKDTDITDVLDPGSYVASADKKMKITRKEAEKFPISFELEDYKEGEKTEKPEVYMLDKYIFKNGEKAITPAQAFERTQKKFPVIEDATDPYTKKSNQENIMARDKVLKSIIQISESKKPKSKEEVVPKAQYSLNTGTMMPNGVFIPSSATNPGIYGYQSTAPVVGIPNIDPYANLATVSTGQSATDIIQNRTLPSGAPNTYSAQSTNNTGGGGGGGGWTITQPIGSLISIGGQIHSAIQNARTARELRREMATQQENITAAYDDTRNNLQSARTLQLLGNLALNTDRVDTTLSDSAYQNINPTAQRNALDAAGSRTLGSLNSAIRNNPYLDRIGRQALTAQTANQLYDQMIAGSNKYYEQRFLRDKGIMDTANTNAGLRAQEDKRQQTLQNQQTANSFSTLASNYTDRAALALNQQRELNQLRLMGILGPSNYNQAIGQNIVNIGNDVTAAGPGLSDLKSLIGLI